MELTLDILAIVGYSMLLAFSVYKLNDTISNPVDLVANFLLVMGLTTLIAYHVRSYKLHEDEHNNDMQKKLRLVAHSSLTTFLMLTLTPLSKAVFQTYDWLALVAHASLFVSVATGMTQIIGVGLLALYFVFATGRKIGQTGPEVLNLGGRFIMSMFFIVAFAQTAMKM